MVFIKEQIKTKGLKIFTLKMELKYMNKYIEAVRDLANEKQPSFDISEILYNHGCIYLLSKIKGKNKYTDRLKAENLLNKICINERYKTCSAVFREFKENNISYAVIKGAVLSAAAYNNPFCRQSGDIDILINRRDIDKIKEIMLRNGFVQGKITENGVEPFSRKEILFQTAMSHQTAPFVKKTNNKICPYINVDLNFDIMWGESETKADMEFVLQNTMETAILGVTFNKLSPEMEFISLCLHHYKDLNSIYLLYERGLTLSHFCDIYFFIKNCNIDSEALYNYCLKLNVGKYVYYCLYYTNLIFDDEIIKKYMLLLHSTESDAILNSFGLSDKERQSWDIDFFTRLFDLNIREYLDNTLSKEALNKIQINQTLM